jgi:hypothetical protein
MLSALVLVATLISESERVISLSKKNQWDDFFAREQVRQRLIKQLDLRNVSLSEQQDRELRRQMQSLITLNSQIEGVCAQKRSEIVSELKKLDQGSKAKKAYS